MRVFFSFSLKRKKREKKTRKKRKEKTRKKKGKKKRTPRPFLRSHSSPRSTSPLPASFSMGTILKTVLFNNALSLSDPPSEERTGSASAAAAARERLGSAKSRRSARADSTVTSSRPCSP